MALWPGRSEQWKTLRSLIWTDDADKADAIGCSSLSCEFSAAEYVPNQNKTADKKDKNVRVTVKGDA
jgi:hypothetical protein